MNSLKNLGFTTKSSLCPIIWNSDKTLNSDVKEILFKNAKEFINFLKIPLKPKEIVLIGSIAGYNWSKYSDIDVHIMVDIAELGYDNDLLLEFFHAKKTIWNEQTNAKIKNFDIEMYIQDINSENISNGVYSIVQDKWLQEPTKKHEDVDMSSLKSKVEALQYSIDDALKDPQCTIECLKDLKKKLKKMRTTGLEEGGEYSIENMAFKALRRNGYIEKLINKISELKDKELSLESIMDDVFMMKEANSGGMDDPDIVDGANDLYNFLEGYFNHIINNYGNYFVGNLFPHSDDKCVGTILIMSNKYNLKIYIEGINTSSDKFFPKAGHNDENNFVLFVNTAKKLKECDFVKLKYLIFHEMDHIINCYKNNNKYPKTYKSPETRGNKKYYSQKTERSAFSTQLISNAETYKNVYNKTFSQYLSEDPEMIKYLSNIPKSKITKFKSKLLHFWNSI